MKTNKYLLIAVLLCSMESIAQNNNTGLILPDINKVAEIPFLPGAGAVEIGPDTDLSAQMPPVDNQGRQGSCTAWSLAYYLRSYQERQIQEWSSYHSGRIFSPGYLYNIAKGAHPNECRTGIQFTDAFKICMKKGYCSLKSYAYDTAKDGCKINQPVPVVDYASDYANVGFGRAQITENGFKKLLSVGYPIIVGINLDAGFTTGGRNAYAAGKKYIYKYNNNMDDYHAVLCVGYDDNTRLFKFINSYGPKWGSAGYFYIPYAYLANTVREAYVSWVINTAVIDAYQKNTLAKEFKVNAIKSDETEIGTLVADNKNKQNYIGIADNEYAKFIPTELAQSVYTIKDEKLYQIDLEKVNDTSPTIYIYNKDKDENLELIDANLDKDIKKILNKKKLTEKDKHLLYDKIQTN